MVSARQRDPAVEEQFMGALYRGGELLASGKVVEAREHLEKAHQLQPKNEKAQNLLGLTYFKLGLFDQAAHVYELLVRENPADPTLRVNLGLVYLKSQDLDRAVKEFETATDLEPGHKKAHSYLGLALAQHGQYERAREHFVQAGSGQMAEKMARAAAAQVPAADPTPPPPQPLPLPVSVRSSRSSIAQPVLRPSRIIAPPAPPTEEAIEMMSDDGNMPADAEPMSGANGRAVHWTQEAATPPPPPPRTEMEEEPIDTTLTPLPSTAEPLALQLEALPADGEAMPMLDEGAVAYEAAQPSWLSGDGGDGAVAPMWVTETVADVPLTAEAPLEGAGSLEEAVGRVGTGLAAHAEDEAQALLSGDGDRAWGEQTAAQWTPAPGGAVEVEATTWETPGAASGWTGGETPAAQGWEPAATSWTDEAAATAEGSWEGVAGEAAPPQAEGDWARVAGEAAAREAAGGWEAPQAVEPAAEGSWEDQPPVEPAAEGGWEVPASESAAPAEGGWEEVSERNAAWAGSAEAAGVWEGTVASAAPPPPPPGEGTWEGAPEPGTWEGTVASAGAEPLPEGERWEGTVASAPVVPPDGGSEDSWEQAAASAAEATRAEGWEGAIEGEELPQEGPSEGSEDTVARPAEQAWAAQDDVPLPTPPLPRASAPSEPEPGMLPRQEGAQDTEWVMQPVSEALRGTPPARPSAPDSGLPSSLSQGFSPLKTQRLTELGQSAAWVQEPSAGPFQLGPAGLAVSVHGEMLSRMTGLVAVVGAVESEPEMRRRRGRPTGEPFGVGGDQLQRVRGQGVLYLEASQSFRSIDLTDQPEEGLDDDGAYAREELVFAFEEGLSFENGRLSSESQALELVHLKGTGRVLFRLEGELTAMPIPAGTPTVVPVGRLVGWFGRVTPRLVDFGGQGAVELTGEGYALLSTS